MTIDDAQASKAQHLSRTPDPHPILCYPSHILSARDAHPRLALQVDEDGKIYDCTLAGVGRAFVDRIRVVNQTLIVADKWMVYNDEIPPMSYRHSLDVSASLYPAVAETPAPLRWYCIIALPTHQELQTGCAVDITSDLQTIDDKQILMIVQNGYNNDLLTRWINGIRGRLNDPTYSLSIPQGQIDLSVQDIIVTALELYVDTRVVIIAPQIPNGLETWSNRVEFRYLDCSV